MTTTRDMILALASEKMKQDKDFAAWVVKEFNGLLDQLETALEHGVPSEDEDDSDPTDEQIYDLAHASGTLRDGELEMDPDAKISRGDANGAYVQTWLWVSFDGTPFDHDGKAEAGG